MKHMALCLPAIAVAAVLNGGAAFGKPLAPLPGTTDATPIPPTSSTSPAVPLGMQRPTPPSSVNLTPAGPRNLAPTPFRMMSPVGMSANFTYANATSHRTELGVTDDQVKQMDALRQKFFDDRTKRMSSMQSLQQQIQTLSQTDPVDLTKIEPLVRQLSTVRGDDTLSDIRLNEAYKKILTADQRAKMKDLAPEFPAMMPPHMPMNMPGMQGMGGMAGMRGMPNPNLAPGTQGSAMPAPKQPLPPPPPPS